MENNKIKWIFQELLLFDKHTHIMGIHNDVSILLGVNWIQYNILQIQYTMIIIVSYCWVYLTLTTLLTHINV